MRDDLQVATSERPALDQWLTGAHGDHPLLDAGVPIETLDALERVLAAIDADAPVRVASKRKAFRTLRSSDELSDQRAELVVASMLARVGVPFEFAKAAPDLVLGTGMLGVEVTCRLSADPPEASKTRLGIDLTGHFEEIERSIVSKIAEKAHQGLVMPTILLLNLDRAGWSFLRGPTMWASRIEPIVVGQDAFVGLGVVFSSWDTDYTEKGCVVVKDASVLQPHLSQLAAALDLEG